MTHPINDMSSSLLRMPCANCPFRKEGAILLQKGRLRQIASDLLRDDHATFHCHKTVDRSNDGAWDGEGEYRPSGAEKMCAGASAFLMKRGRPNIQMRLSLITREVPAGFWDKAEEITIDSVAEGEKNAIEI